MLSGDIGIVCSLLLNIIQALLNHIKSVVASLDFTQASSNTNFIENLKLPIKFHTTLCFQLKTFRSIRTN